MVKDPPPSTPPEAALPRLFERGEPLDAARGKLFDAARGNSAIETREEGGSSAFSFAVTPTRSALKLSLRWREAAASLRGWEAAARGDEPLRRRLGASPPLGSTPPRSPLIDEDGTPSCGEDGAPSCGEDCLLSCGKDGAPPTGKDGAPSCGEDDDGSAPKDGL